MEDEPQKAYTSFPENNTQPPREASLIQALSNKHFLLFSQRHVISVCKIRKGRGHGIS